MAHCMQDVHFIGSIDAPATRRAEALGAQISSEASLEKRGVVLEPCGDRLTARLREWPRAAAFQVDFEPARLADATRSPLVRASGSPKGVLLDATAGFGGDAMSFAAAGWTVIAIERNPWVHWLLEEGLAAAKGDPRLRDAAARVSLRHADAAAVLEAMARGDRAEAGLGDAPIDVVLLDPMFPIGTRSKTALPPKSAQLLRALAGEDHDASPLLELARRVCTRRVIVKRPPWAEPLQGEPEFTIETKLLRVDAYRPQR
ncbi:MAG: class I SAM-dependent methyltransferase [Phycisphaerales bacterium]